MTAITNNTYTAVSRQRFAISFKYRQASELVVTVDDVTKTLGTDYQVIASTNTVLFASPVTGEVKLQRTTGIATSAIAVDFTTLTHVSSSELNEVFEQQVLYGFQEVKMDEIVPMQATVLVAKVNNLSDLTSNSLARSNLEVYSVSEVDAKMDPVIAGSLVFANNLSDVTDVATARDNLGLGNKAYSDAQIAGVLKAANNLSDLADLSAARSSLDIYSKDEFDPKIDQEDYAELYMYSADNLNLLPDVSASRDNVAVDSKEELDAKMAALLALAIAHPPPTPAPTPTFTYTVEVAQPASGSTNSDELYVAIPVGSVYFTTELVSTSYTSTTRQEVALGARNFVTQALSGEDGNQPAETSTHIMIRALSSLVVDESVVEGVVHMATGGTFADLINNAYADTANGTPYTLRSAFPVLTSGSTDTAVSTTGTQGAAKVILRFFD